jgi:hypothetical protein
MSNFICTTLYCLSLINFPARIVVKSSDALIYNNDNKFVYCLQKENLYNCKPTSNLFNPIDN